MLGQLVMWVDIMILYYALSLYYVIIMRVGVHNLLLLLKGVHLAQGGALWEACYVSFTHFIHVVKGRLGET